jgi:CubicO group peptidase (beta-lactamase class C family)
MSTTSSLEPPATNGSAGRGIPADIGDGWPISAPEAAGIDSLELGAVVDWLDGLPRANIHSVLVVRGSTLVFEHYRNGADERWRVPLPSATHGPEVKHDLRSATKSVTGLLMGLVLERKLIPSLEESIFQYFREYPDLRTVEKDRIRVRHLLTMSAGLEWDENVPDIDPIHGEMRMWRSRDHLRTALEPHLVAAPGQVWNYSGGCTELLGALLQRLAGQPIDEFASEMLLEPLGITDVESSRHADGSPSASGGLRMRSRDLAKIGQLVVGRGQWKGRQIIPAQWIDDSRAPHIGAADRLYFLRLSMVARAIPDQAAGDCLGSSGRLWRPTPVCRARVGPRRCCHGGTLRRRNAGLGATHHPQSLRAPCGQARLKRRDEELMQC